MRARLRQWDAAISDATQVCIPLFSPALSLILHQVHQDSTIRHWLHCKEFCPRRRGRKAQGISGVRYRVRALPFNSRYLSPFDQGVCPMHSSLVALGSSYSQGYHRVYGWRARRRDIPHRRPHRYCAVQLNMLCGSGMCITHYHAKNITTDVANRRTCTSSLEIRSWRIMTMRVRYDRSSVHEPKCGPTRVKRSLWSHS